VWKVELKPEIKKELKDPELFAKGLANVYTGLTVSMAAVFFMFILVFQKPEDSLKPSWIILVGFAIIGWGEWQKYRGK
tara:strand:- start:272 stop:505 length:234 start_codon:yes stop_codon:yes gene_type:complete